MKQTDPLLKVIKPDTSHFSFNFEPFLRREFHFGLDPGMCFSILFFNIICVINANYIQIDLYVRVMPKVIALEETIAQTNMFHPIFQISK